MKYVENLAKNILLMIEEMDKLNARNIMFYLLIFAIIANTNLVRKYRADYERAQINQCKAECSKSYESELSKYNQELKRYKSYLNKLNSNDSRQWQVEQNIRDINFQIQQTKEYQKDCERSISCEIQAYNVRDIKVIRATSFTKNIAGGLAITTANILDGVLGGIVFIVKIPFIVGYFIGNVNKDDIHILDKSIKKLTTDISFFENIVLDLDLFHAWPTLSQCRADLWDKGYYYNKDSNRIWQGKCGISDWWFGKYSWDFDDFVRLFTNIFVCIVFLVFINKFFVGTIKNIEDKETE